MSSPDWSLLAQYGILGLWTINLLYDKYIDRKDAKDERKAIVKVLERLSSGVELLLDRKRG